MNDQLNSKLFDLESSKLKSQVRNRLLEISREFLKEIDDSVNFDILDIRLVGSNAAYNYNEHSDIDLHIVVNLYQVCRDHPEVVQAFFNSEKSRFNYSYDIKIKDIEVEIYVEDVRAGTHTSAIYSILQDQWVKEPKIPDEIPSTKVDKDLVDRWSEEIEVALEGDSSDISSILNRIYLVRKSSLDTEGEYGEGNLLFKEIRYLGLLDDLRSQYKVKRSKELTLESVKRSRRLFEDRDNYCTYCETHVDVADDQVCPLCDRYVVTHAEEQERQDQTDHEFGKIEKDIKYRFRFITSDGYVYRDKKSGTSIFNLTKSDAKTKAYFMNRNYGTNYRPVRTD